MCFVIYPALSSLLVISTRACSDAGNGVKNDCVILCICANFCVKNCSMLCVHALIIEFNTTLDGYRRIRKKKAYSWAHAQAFSVLIVSEWSICPPLHLPSWGNTNKTKWEAAVPKNSWCWLLLRRLPCQTKLNPKPSEDVSFKVCITCYCSYCLLIIDIVSCEVVTVPVIC